MADVYGVFSRCFLDCGSEPFIVFDKDGEQLKEVFINHISSDGIVTVAGDERHPFQDGDIISFRELIGLEKLNKCERTVKDINIHQFSIGDISSIEGEYKRGGIAREIKQKKEIYFVRLKILV
jgi:ubiquitin-activating enzyme E1